MQKVGFMGAQKEIILHSFGVMAQKKKTSARVTIIVEDTEFGKRWAERKGITVEVLTMNNFREEARL